MKTAIVGSRSFDDYEYMQNILKWHNISLIISGGAKGADQLAEKYSKEKNIPFKIFLPHWDVHGKSAGVLRNKQIVSDCDQLIAFWDGKSKGTKHSIDIATEQNKPVYIYWPTYVDKTEQILKGIG